MDKMFNPHDPNSKRQGKPFHPLQKTDYQIARDWLKEATSPERESRALLARLDQYRQYLDTLQE